MVSFYVSASCVLGENASSLTVKDLFLHVPYK